MSSNTRIHAGEARPEGTINSAKDVSRMEAALLEKFQETVRELLKQKGVDAPNLEADVGKMSLNVRYNQGQTLGFPVEAAPFTITIRGLPEAKKSFSVLYPAEMLKERLEGKHHAIMDVEFKGSHFEPSAIAIHGKDPEEMLRGLNEVLFAPVLGQENALPYPKPRVTSPDAWEHVAAAGYSEGKGREF